MNIYETLENSAKQVTTQNLTLAIRLRGVRCKHKKAKKSVYTDVYGTSSGKTEVISRDVTVLLTGDLFTAAGGSPLSTFQEGMAYSQDPEISAGDTLEIQRLDGKTRVYYINTKEVIGTTDVLMYRFRLSAKNS